MTDDLHKETRELIHSVEIKDKRFRMFQSIFSVTIIILLIMSLFYGYRYIQQEQQKRAEAVQAVVVEVGKNRTLISCVVRAFEKDNYAQSKEIVDQCLKHNP